MASQMMSANQQELLARSAQGLRTVLRQLRSANAGRSGESSYSEEESEGGEPLVGHANPSGQDPRSHRTVENPGGSPITSTTGLLLGGAESFPKKSGSGQLQPPVSEETLATLTEVLGNIDEMMREVQNAAFNPTLRLLGSSGISEADNISMPGGAQSFLISHEDGGGDDSNNTPGIPSISVKAERTNRTDPLGGRSPSSVRKHESRGQQPSEVATNGDAHDGAWATPFDTEGLEVDQDVAQWLTTTYAADYHRETTGFEVKLQQGRDSVVSLSCTLTDCALDSKVATPNVEGIDSFPHNQEEEQMFLEDEKKNATFKNDEKLAKYARKNVRSHNAFCSLRRLHQTLKMCGIEKIEGVNDSSFDIFEHNDQLGDDVFTHVCLNVLLQYSFVWSLQLNVMKLQRYLRTIQGLYQSKNPYHNATHAADVLQTTNVYLCAEGVKENFSDVELFAVLFAALTHDVGHVGINNAFLINTRHPIARLSNDRSPLESLHVMLAFEILELEECNFFAESSTFKKEHFDDFRGLVVHSVLGTDMKFHTELIKTAKDILEDGEIDDDEVRDLFRAIVHAADLSNPMKPKHIYLKWADRVVAEFWLQGDEERRTDTAISMMCDRNGANIAKSQLGFINFIVKPFMKELSPLLPPVWLLRLQENASYMETLSGPDEAERIAAITELSKDQWTDTQPSATSYHRVVNRLVKGDYKVQQRQSVSGGMTIPQVGPATAALANHFAITSPGNGTLSPGAGSNTSYFENLDLKAQMGQLESEYLQLLVGVADDLVHRIVKEGKEDRRMISRLPKRVSFTSGTGLAAGDLDSNSNSNNENQIQSNSGSMYGGMDGGKLDLVGLSQVWMSTVLGIQLTATEQAQAEKGTSALSDVELVPHPVLKPYLPRSEELENDLVFEMTPEIVSAITADGNACQRIVKLLASQNHSMDSPKALSKISFNSSITRVTDQMEAAAALTAEGPGASLRSVLCKLTHLWVTVFNSEQAQLASLQASTPTTTPTKELSAVRIGVTSAEGTPQALATLSPFSSSSHSHHSGLSGASGDRGSVGSLPLPRLQVLNGESSFPSNLSGGDRASHGLSPASTTSSTLDAPVAGQGRKHSTLLELLSGQGVGDSMNRSNTSWAGSVAGTGAIPATSTATDNPTPANSENISSQKAAISTNQSWTRPALSSPTSTKTVPASSSFDVSRGYVLRTRSTSAAWNSNNNSSNNTAGVQGVVQPSPSLGQGNRVYEARSTTTPPVMVGGRYVFDKMSASVHSRPGELKSATPEPTSMRKQQPALPSLKK